MRTTRRHRARRFVAALLAGACLPLAAPPAAWAREDEKNLWGEWWNAVTDRSIKVEIPFVFLVTLPAMILITPVWLTQRVYAGLTSKDDAS
jgi:hypothetical protein